ncbi:ABC efflux pump, inner membrane subunit [Candidatus Koribacter versatilis Ellin345]|uniref:ABC efflux pump, inner membrane subunit n=1 Tax=Koribacter versatilis (strain Ellin345) TaxID=204669 RepID=Q1IKY8_KORVE|nr:ABC transporter permease [Candidatus Koribacter versatilis]ABF42462.1 ABC efflux pump, inner membrane subunit [Candidatus Koribacter versatilis Ellin345]
MKALRHGWARIRNFAFGRSNRERLREEMEEHVALQTEENIRSGMSAVEARRQALIKLGPVEAVGESYHAEESLPILETVLQDCRYGVRMLKKSPVFSSVAVLTLALGIGANAAIFTLVHALMLKKLPVADPKSLVRLGNNNDCCVGAGFHDSGEVSLFTTSSYEFLKKNTTEFEELAAIQAGFAYRPVVVRREGAQQTPRSVMGEFVSGNYFKTFGLTPVAGRLLEDSDDVIGAPMTAVMSYETWKNAFDRDPSVVGSTMYVNTKPVTVVGIAPENFYGDRLLSTPPEFYLPIETMPPIANAPYVHGSEMQWLYIIGRLKPGVSRAVLEQKISELLREQLVTTQRFSSKEGRERLRKAHIVLSPAGGGIQALQQQYDKHLKLLMWVSGLVLLIACANIANLLLVRGMARKAEINVRTALGAKRGRIVRQLLTESVLLAGIGGGAGLLVAYAGTRMLLVLAFPGAQQVPIHAAPSPAVLAFAFGLSLLTGVLFGMAPAWIAAKSEPVEALHRGTRSVIGGATLLQRGLVVMQAGLSLVLLVGAGLFAQSLSKLQHIDLKLDATNRYIVHINPQTAGYSQRQVGELYRLLEERFHLIPEVEKVGITSYSPMEDNNDSWDVMVQGKPYPHTLSSVLRVSPEYFDSVGTHLVMGRGIGVQDTETSPTVAVVNRTFVNKLFQPGENPIGQHFGGSAASVADFEIVGVVEDTVYSDARWRDHLMFFMPLLQRPASDKDPIESDESLFVSAIVLKTSRPVPEMETLARKTLSAINPNLSVVKFQTFESQIYDQFAEDRMVSRLTTLFGALALLLATLGLYGVTAYGVARRTPEIGIRMALGAHRGGVMTMVVRGAMVQALIGLAIGVPAALLCARFVTSQLYEVKGVDARVLVGAVLTLGVAASIAALIPARRAATIDPARALRTE